MAAQVRAGSTAASAERVRREEQDAPGPSALVVRWVVMGYSDPVHDPDTRAPGRVVNHGQPRVPCHALTPEPDHTRDFIGSSAP